MARLPLLPLLFLLFSCGNNKAPATGATEGNKENSSALDAFFATRTPPYLLTDTTLLRVTDTAQIHLAAFEGAVPDTLLQKLFGAKAKMRYTPLARFRGKEASFYLVKASSGSRQAALLLAGGADGITATLPFLVPDADKNTSQVSTLDKSFSVLRSTTKRGDEDLLVEGKDVYAYSVSSGRFELIMTDPLNDVAGELVNPIDTLSRRSSLAGDYSRGKKNFVSIRDGRKPGLLTVFIHIEDESGECTGEIKGDAQVVSANAAVFSQAGDPCVLNIQWGKNNVTLAEQEGCGSRRGLTCSFNGVFTRKKEAKPKNNATSKGAPDKKQRRA